MCQIVIIFKYNIVFFFVNSDEVELNSRYLTPLFCACLRINICSRYKTYSKEKLFVESVVSYVQ